MQKNTAYIKWLKKTKTKLLGGRALSASKAQTDVSSTAAAIQPSITMTDQNIKMHKIALIGTALALTAYLLASLLNSLVVYAVISTMPNTKINMTPSSHRMDTKSDLNYFDLRKTVLERHLFNATGQLPKEAGSASGDNQQNPTSCTPSTLNLKLTGTIINENPELSVATIVDNILKITDVYRTGDTLIDQPARIVSIERSMVTLNHRGKNECLKITAKKNVNTELTYRPQDINEPLPPDPSLVPREIMEEEPAEVSGEVIVLKDSYVEEQLGEGFVKIVEAARFVPKQDESGVPIGFHIFGIKPGTLFTRIGLKNGDIINQVNSTSLRQIEQGFALYQALQDETDIIIRLQRGNRPMSIKLKIE
ncbi:MAG: hypothetical protein OXC44_03910 [Proteobacteria bacterium]|nr:hypothetical protein [Pseudomonadota bacterium]